MKWTYVLLFLLIVSLGCVVRVKTGPISIEKQIDNGANVGQHQSTEHITDQRLKCSPEVKGIDYEFFPIYKNAIRVEYVEDDSKAFPYRKAAYCLIVNNDKEYTNAVNYVKSQLENMGYHLCSKSSFGMKVMNKTVNQTSMEFSDLSKGDCINYKTSGRLIMVEIRMEKRGDGTYKLVEEFTYNGLDDEQLPSINK